MIFTSWDSGIDEMTWSAGTVRTPSPSDTVTDTAPASSSRWIPMTAVFNATVAPSFSAFSVQRSHIMPGPYFGYWNSSIRLVTSVCLRRGDRALRIALDSDRFLIRCAAQSDWIDVAGMPHSFSVYGLKKVEDRPLAQRAGTPASQ